ncbi:hypothetical protein AVEN_167717-1 [Araneus ventricosus]|uniref:Uncharacterized protein n=1 Tax=Araneus ventricosus TaxID=182803 RepID=A0A4Y2HM53_ARAVE|nr:hypothetical protein AVEN_167717-1 [Araneus ventricosus]
MEFLIDFFSLPDALEFEILYTYVILDDNILTKLALWMYGASSPNKEDNGERRFIHEYFGKHEAQMTKETTLLQISYSNRQQITSNNSSSTFNNAQLTRSHCRQNSKVIHPLPRASRYL